MDTAIIAALVGGITALMTTLGTIIVNIIRAKKEPDKSDLELQDQLEKEKAKNDAAIEAFTEFGKEVKSSIEELKFDLNTKFDNVNKKLGDLESTNDDMLRNTLTHLYFKYKDQKKIPHYEKENVLHLYASYNGNSYVEAITEEMKGWEEII